MEITRLIREARLDAGLTQTELANRAGTSQATLSAYEAGTKTPTGGTLSRLVAATGRRLTTERAARPMVTPSQAELERRGRILMDVLELADALPHRREGPLRYPPLVSQVRR